MNKQEGDILINLLENKYKNQRELSCQLGYSLGNINKSINNLFNENYLNENMIPTKKALKLFEDNKPKNAIILAAGYGMRMVPINTSYSKGLLEVNGEKLIERLIKQLQEVGINKIYIVVGFLKEQYEYLIDKYNVNLIVNSEYSNKNNLFSLKLVANEINNTYILPCDIWCKTNPFRKNEIYSWYMINKKMNNKSNIIVDRNYDLKLNNKRER